MSKSEISRREVLKAGAMAGAGMTAVGAIARAAEQQPGVQAANTGTPPIAISSANGLRATEIAVDLMRKGGDVVEAAVEGIVPIEEDPEDTSVGYGGLPNELGTVELDACVMHGPTMRAGAVASLQNIKTPSRVAKLVMERTDHILLVGPGALYFAKMMGFKEEDLLTERARQAWLRWKTRHPRDNWLDDDEIKMDFPMQTGTVTCLCLNDKRDLGGCTSTSGLAWKIPGRVGDSPIIGAGLYVDNAVGACGSTGRGEANILVSGSRIVVENMRHGMTPEAAILDVLKRVVDMTTSPRLIHRPGRPSFDLNFYAIRKDGAYAGGRIYRGGFYAVHDGKENRRRESVYLYESPNA
jgi:N4-(beta-N-acetylglucosaminyl)-L-asparaginase